MILVIVFGLVGGVFAQEDPEEQAREAARLAAESTSDLVLAGWSSSAEEDATLQALLTQFTEETGITVDFIPSPNHPLTMQTSFASGQYANVFYVDSSILPDWVNAGVIDVGEGKIADVEGLYPNLLEVFTVDGILYCPPKDFSTLALEYNKDLFDAANVAYPTAEWTWEDLRTAAEALNDPENGILGIVMPVELARWLPFIYQGGGTVLADDGTFGLDSAESREALEFFIQLHADGIASTPDQVDSGWSGEAFGKGRAAMTMEGNWVINFLLQNYPELNWGVAPLPAGPAGQATMAFTVCYGVGATNDNLDASWQLVNFLTGAQGQISTAEVSFGPMPSNSAAAEAYVETWEPRTEGLGFDPADVQVFIDAADYSYRWQFPVGFNVVGDTFNASLQRAVKGDATLDDVIFETQLAFEDWSSR